MSKSYCAVRLRSVLFILSLGILAVSACTDGDSSHATESASAPVTELASDASTPGTSPTAKVATPRVHAEGESAPRNPNERPLPAFEGVTIAGTRLAIRDLLDPLFGPGLLFGAGRCLLPTRLFITL
jgi:hypothetical protein